MSNRWQRAAILASLIAYPILSLHAAQKKIYQCVSIPGGGGRGGGGGGARGGARAENLKTYVVAIDAVSAIANPGLVVLADGLEAARKGTVDVNGHTYQLPASPGGLLAKIVVPLKPEHLVSGINRVAFAQGGGGEDTWTSVDARIEDVAERSTQVVKTTYLPRSAAPSLEDFDFVTNPNNLKKRQESEIPEWAQRGKFRFYRAGVDMNHLDRMFEMFKEGRFNVVMLQNPTPSEATGADFEAYKAFFDRCHAAGIKIMYDGGNESQPVRLNSLSLESVLLHPSWRSWISKDEYGVDRWRTPRRAFWPDVGNQDYRNECVRVAGVAMEAGADAAYFDWAIGGTSNLVQFFADIRALAERKGKNWAIYGNCKGNIPVEELCDFTKSEGTEEAGIWDGKWVNNVAQSRFYYAAGGGWKPYESKYEGADAGNPDPGAHSVRDGMKTGWKRPIAEAWAFQSQFAIAEAGRGLLQGWVNKNNEIAMAAWRDICLYNGFVADNEDLYTDVRTVSKIALLAPPAIPSFEVRLARAPLYNALGEMNFMYNVVLVSRLDEQSLAGYKAVVLPDVTLFDEAQVRMLEKYRQAGGQILAVGSAENLRKLATVTLPASLLEDIQKQPARDEFKQALIKVSGGPQVTVQNADYAISNLVKKTSSERVIAHLVNYSKAAENVNVRLDLAGVVRKVDPKSIRLFSPDDVSKELKDVVVNGTAVSFTIPKLDIYDVVSIN